jgi:PAS domain S-box-containing protein
MSQQPYFQQADEETDVTISSPFTSLRTGQPTVWLVRQVDGGGMVVGELSLGALQEAINARLDRTYPGTTFVSDHFGTLLAHPEPALVAQRANVSDLKIVQRGMSGEEALIYTDEGQLILGSAVPVERTGWIVVVQTPLLAVYAPYATMMGIVFVLITLLELGLMWKLRQLLSRRIVEPLARVRRGADALANGDFAKGNALTAAPRYFTELNALISNFRRMSLAIQTRQAALRESETKYRMLIEQSEDAIYLLYKNKFEVINPKFEELFGITAKEAQAPDFDFRNLVAPQSRPLITERQRQLANGVDLSPRYEFTALNKNGDEIEVEVSVSYVPYRGGTATQGVLRDITERKQMEETLRFQAQLLDSVQESVVATDLEGKIIYWGKGAAKLYGYRAENIMGTPIKFVVEPEDDTKEEKWMQQVRKKGTWHGQYRRRRKDGSHFWADTFVSLVRDEQGVPYGMIGIDRDITTRKQAQQALWESRDRLSKIMLAANDGMWDWDLSTDVVYFDPRYYEMAGYPREAFPHRLEEFKNRVHPDDVDDVMGQAQAYLRGERDRFAAEFRFREKDGGWLWVMGRGVIVERDKQGAPLRFVGTHTDITERKQIEEEREQLLDQIQQQAQRMQQTINTVPEGVLLLDADQQILLTNPVAEKLLPTLAGADLGDRLSQLGDRPIGELLNSPPTEGLWHRVENNGEVFEVISRPVYNQSQPENWVLVIRDVTREREIEHRIRQQERLAAVGQLAAGIAHDFNNIMATIVLYAQMLSRTEGLSAHSQEQLSAINNQAKQATDLIQQILDFSRRAVFDRKPIDLLPLLKEQTKLLTRTLPENIQVELSVEPGEYLVNADPTRIQQVLTNLAVNARDAMPQGGNLHIGLGHIALAPQQTPPLPEMEPGNWIWLRVEDTGVGIHSEKLPHIFEPFFTTKEPGEGSGLGLAQVHGIIRQHAGHIDVKTAVNEGSTFTIYLPVLAVQPPKSPPSELTTLVKGNGETILVVEDNASTRQALKTVLETLNYKVVEAANGEEALSRLETTEVALILSDVVMPKMGGRALLYALKERKIAAPVILLTGHPLENELETLSEVGLSNWLSKPPSLTELAEAVNQALNHRN